MSNTELLNYKAESVIVSSSKTNVRIPINARFVYLLFADIDISVRINNVGADAFTFNYARAIQAPDGKEIKEIFLSWTSTSSNPVQLIMSQENLFPGVGNPNDVTIVSSGGVEYTLFPVKLQTSAGLDYDGRMANYGRAQLLDFDGSDASAHDTIEIVVATYRQVTFTIENNSDQTLTIKLYGLCYGATYFQIGSDITILAGATEIITLSDAYYSLKINYQLVAISGTNGVVINYLLRS